MRMLTKYKNNLFPFELKDRFNHLLKGISLPRENKMTEHQLSNVNTEI